MHCYTLITAIFIERMKIERVPQTRIQQPNHIDLHTHTRNPSICWQNEQKQRVAQILIGYVLHSIIPKMGNGFFPKWFFLFASLLFKETETRNRTSAVAQRKKITPK